MTFRHSPAIVFAFVLMVLALTTSCGSGPDVSKLNKTPSTNTNPAPTELELSGLYLVSGADENNGHPYEGTLDVTNQGDAYLFNWHTNPSKHGGVGVQMGDAVAVTYADPVLGKGCGVVLYKIAADGSLDGKIAKWGEYTFGSEKAVKVEGKNFDGKYNVNGVTNDGKPYEGTIVVEKNGKGYQFTWHTGIDSTGFGIWRGSRAAISFGGLQCSFALYQVMSARSLEGHWGGQRSVNFGTETAKRK